jgi:hypothetical protein
MKAIINRGSSFGQLDKAITSNSNVLREIVKHLKADKAKLLLDTDHTLMYELEKIETNKKMIA